MPTGEFLPDHFDALNINMITCGGQATIPIVHAVTRVTPVPYAEIISSVASASAGQGTRANIDEFTRTTARAVESVGGAVSGKAIIILNPVEPPMIMRNTVFCAISPDADRDAISASIHAMAEDVRRYVPGYTLRADPQYDDPQPGWSGRARVAVFLQISGNGDYLPEWAGNLDIMTAAAARVGDLLAHPAQGRLYERHRARRRPRQSGRGAAARQRPGTRRDLRITDTTLRDGSHAVAHQFTEEQVRSTVSALDHAGVEVIEVSHGDGLGGSSFNYGFSRQDEIRLVAAAVDEAIRAKIAVLLLPGIGTVDDLSRAADAGATVARIATHCTEADVSPQHFRAARRLGMETVGFLMLAHRASPSVLARQARVMVDAGAECVYVVDSAGAMLIGDVQARIDALIGEIGADAQVGFHGHQNLMLGVANSVLAFQQGARQVDGALCALGAGAGNAPTEVLVATFSRLGIATDVDMDGVLAAAELVVRPMLPRLPWPDRSAIVQGYAGVYSSFLLHAERAAQRYSVPAHEILQRVAEAGYVGGQEDMIIDVALELSAERHR